MRRQALLRLEIAQQSIENFLILVMVFPSGEIANVAFMTYLCCPIKRAFKHSLIYTDGEEDCPFLLALHALGSGNCSDSTEALPETV